MYALTYLAYYSIQFQAKVFEHDYIYLPLCSLKNWYMHKDFFLCTLYNVHIIQALGSRFCQWSKESAVSVSVCPKSKSTMEVRAKNKNCKAIVGFKIVQFVKSSNTTVSWMSLRQSLLKCVHPNIIYTVRCYDLDAP